MIPAGRRNGSAGIDTDTIGVVPASVAENLAEVGEHGGTRSPSGAPSHESTIFTTPLRDLGPITIGA